MKAPATEAQLTFVPSNDRGFPFILFLCVLGSLLLHASTFFLFQVVYPQRVTIPPPAPRVSLLTPSSPENIALLRWIEAEDPALVASDNAAAPPGLAEVRYRPSFATPRTAPLGAPAEQPQAVRFPAARDRLVPAESSGLLSAAAVAAPVQETTVRYSSALAPRVSTQNPPITFPYHASTPAEPTTLLVGVNTQGAARFVIIQQSSGDPALDQLAAAHVAHVAFVPGTSPITWGFATCTWGGDAYASVKKTP